MGKGFAPVKVKPKKPPAKSAKLTPISQIQADLSSYFNGKSFKRFWNRIYN